MLFQGVLLSENVKGSEKLSLTLAKSKYYKLAEVSFYSDISRKLLKKWLLEGDLNHFLYAYKSKTNTIYYSLNPPSEHNKVIEVQDHLPIYRLEDQEREVGESYG